MSTSARYDSSPSPRSSREKFKQTKRDHSGAVQRLKQMLHQETLPASVSPQRSQHDRTFASIPGVGTRPDMKRPSDNDPLALASFGSGNRPQLMSQENEPHLEDVLPFMSSQSAYIQQLEGENTFCKDEIASLRTKIQNVVDDNITLHEELKTSVVKLALGKDSSDEQDTKDDKKAMRADDSPNLNPNPEPSMDKSSFSQWAHELEQMKSLHESRTNRLEAQLAYTRSELEKYEKQCDDLRSKLRMSESVNLMTRDETQLENGLCIRCAQHEAVIASTHGSTHVKAIERITSERDELMETLTRLKTSMKDLKQREANAYNQVKQSVTMVEQAQLEKTQLLVQREQLREDQSRLQQRMEEMIMEHQRKLLQERGLTRKECSLEVEQLGQKIAKLTDDLGSTQNQLDRVTREKVAVQSELDQCKSQIMQHSSEISQVSHGVHLSTATAKVQRDDAVRQLDRLKHSTEQELRAKEQEIARLNDALSDTKRRLETAEKEATMSKEEGIQLVEKLNDTEREMNQAKMTRDTVLRSRQDEVKLVTRRAQQHEMDLQQTIHELESKHSLTVTELEDMVASHSSLITKLRGEGRTLTEQLDQISNKYRTEIRRLKQTNAELSARLERLSGQHATMETQCVDHGRMHKKMTAQLRHMEEHAERSAQQIYELLEKQSSLMQERQMLNKEVDFLRLQQKNALSLSTRREERGDELDFTPELDSNMPGRGGNG